jgi:hypothetical protein
MTAHFNWNPASWAPMNIDLPILACTNNDKLVVFKNSKSLLNGDVEHPFSNWKWMVDKYNIKFWAYQYEVINTIKEH